jgi:hypothetical protein
MIQKNSSEDSRQIIEIAQELELAEQINKKGGSN